MRSDRSACHDVLTEVPKLNEDLINLCIPKNNTVTNTHKKYFNNEHKKHSKYTTTNHKKTQNKLYKVESDICFGMDGMEQQRLKLCVRGGVGSRRVNTKCC